MSSMLVMMALVMMPSACFASDLYVGGRDGWVQHPSDSYNSWAGRNRFQVEDRLIFRYEKGNDSVLVVSKAAYDSCDTSNPKANYSDGKSVFQFNRSGPFYFISGAAGHCAQGQKLVVVVMSVRNHTTPPPPPSTVPSPSPSPYNAPTPAAPTPVLAPMVDVPPAGDSPPGTSAPATPQTSASYNNVQAVSKGYLGAVMVAAMAVGGALVG